MNIKRASEESGISSQNIRFYEREGLIHPGRQAQNRYREYTAEDIRRLKLIRLFRTLDLPLEQLRRLMAGELSLSEAMETQAAVLERRQAELAAAQRLCKRLAASETKLEALSVDKLLAETEQAAQGSSAPGARAGYFYGWLRDYQLMKKLRYTFHFYPDDLIETPEDFTQELLSYAKREGLDITVTKEGMYPEFLLNGAPYQACRYYSGFGTRTFVSVIRCQRLEVGEASGLREIEERRKFALSQILYARLWLYLFAAAFLLWGLGCFAQTPEQRTVLLIVLCAAAIFWLLRRRYRR